MNQQLRRPDLALTTQAAEGLPRRRWSVAEIEELTRIGVFEEDERFELLGGEIVPMSPKGIRHELIKAALNVFWAARLPPEYLFVPETTFRLSVDTFVEPDFVFYRRADGLAKLGPSTALLAVEVADSSLGYDLGRKARIYATFAIPEVWVIDAGKLVAHVHRRPGLDGYAEIAAVAPGEAIAPAFSPALAVSLDRLELV